MHILLDTNIVLDIAFKRDPFYAKAAEVFKLDSILKSITATTVTDIYYLIRKTKNHGVAIDFLSDLVKIVSVAGVDEQSILNALSSETTDFEDAVQIEVAKIFKIDHIVTRNKADFKFSHVSVMTPDEFLDFRDGK